MKPIPQHMSRLLIAGSVSSGDNLKIEIEQVKIFKQQIEKEMAVKR